MGSNTLNTKNPGDVIASEDPNQYKTASDGNIVPRDTSGIPTDQAGSLGETLLRWFRLFVTKITLGDPDDDVHLEQTSAVMTIKINDVVKFLVDSTGFDGTKMSNSTKLKIQSQEFITPGSFTWAAPFTGQILIKAVGGGGGGGGYLDGNGGQGCIEVETLYDVTQSVVYSGVVGAGGAGGDASGSGGSIGADGGDTTFNSTIIAKGGKGGHFNGNQNEANLQEATFTRGAFVAGTVFSEQIAGRSSAFSGGANSTPNSAGGGGASTYGPGGNGRGSSGVPDAASTSYGAGGGGWGPAAGSRIGGNGAGGKLTIIWIDHD